jgi:predicted ATPase
MIFEDAHWTDPTSLELLGRVVDLVATLRVLLIVTFRLEFDPPWIGQPHVTAMTINRLTQRDVGAMIDRVTGNKLLPASVRQDIIERTDGIPLFIEELTKTVVESGIITEAGDHYAINAPGAPLAIPTTLHGSLLARLDRLAPTRELAQIGAALGRQFSYELIRAVAQMPQQQLDESLTQLLRAELVFQHGTPPDAEYTFKHALVQDAAYSTLLRSRRQQLHGRITATMEREFPEIVEMQPELLARHCAEAGLIEKAVMFWYKAGQQAIGRGAMTEAVAQLRKSLALISGLPEGTDRQERELIVQITFGQALMAAKGLCSAGSKRDLCSC